MPTVSAVVGHGRGGVYSMKLRVMLVTSAVLWGCQSDGADERSAADASGGEATADALGEAIDGASGDDGPGDDDASTGGDGGGTLTPPDGTVAGSDGLGVDGDAPVELEDVVGQAEGAPCVDDAECFSGWCVPSAIGQVCVETCVDQCDAGQACIPAAESGTDPVYLCVPFVAPPGTDTVSSPDGDTSDGDGATTSDGSGSDGGPSDTAETSETTEQGDVQIDDTLDDTSIEDVDPGPDVPGSETVVSDGDSDGDGIPDDEDHLPCLAIYLVVYNNNVSSASLLLNGTEVVGANAFPTTEEIAVFINPTSGDNTLELGGKLTGSPSDTLTLVVIDTEGRIYFAVVIAREPGKPADQTYTFTVDATCP